jgi:hypothetical protein
MVEGGEVVGSCSGNMCMTTDLCDICNSWAADHPCYVAVRPLPGRRPHKADSDGIARRWGMGMGEWRMGGNGEWRMENGGWRMEDGG